MRKLVTHDLIKAHKDVRLILITPPPVEETLQLNLDKAKFPQMSGLRRTVEANAAYANAARTLAQELDIVCLDVWTIMMREAGYRAGDEQPMPGSQTLGVNRKLAELLSDGERQSFHCDHRADL